MEVVLTDFLYDIVGEDPWGWFSTPSSDSLALM